ncbi:MAG: PEP/pyruvate-binding domain-containing protein [Pseudomonadota bacterium]
MAVFDLFKHLTCKVFAPGTILRRKYTAFRDLLTYDNVCLELIADLEEIAFGSECADYSRITWLSSRLSAALEKMSASLMTMDPVRYADLPLYHGKIDTCIRMGLDLPQPEAAPPHILPLGECVAKPHLAGGKAANLATSASIPGIPVPRAYVVTIPGSTFFLESNALTKQLQKRLRHIVLSRPEALADHCRQAQSAVMAAKVPDSLARELAEAAAMLSSGGKRLALRSSARAEDGEISFAGQFVSVLDVPADKVLDAFKTVVAGKYSPRAVTYRILSGLADEDIPMAVLVMAMVDAREAGVMYTCDPAAPKEKFCRDGHLAIYAVPGQGRALVDGCIAPHIRRFTRTARPERLPDGETKISSPEDFEVSQRLAALGMRLERHFGQPQDIEWAVDQHGEITLLQTRPLIREHPDPKEDSDTATLKEALGNREVLADGLTRVSAGMACGPVCVAEAVFDAQQIPRGSVLFVHNLHPSLVRILGQVAAVVSRTGSRGSHFASVAREFGLPVVVKETLAPDIFTPGRRIIVDADQGRILAGCPDSLAQEKGFRGRVPDRLKKVLPYISPLSLTDPDSPDFRPDNAKSFHDLVRFMHEKGTAEMFSLVDRGGKNLSGAVKLKSGLPLSMYILDLGGGFFDHAAGLSEITPNDFKSRLLTFFWQGLSDPKVKWSGGLTHMDWEEFDRVSAGLFIKEAKSLASYVVVSDCYLHCMIRFGYHFSVIDSYCGQRPENNYIRFRFKGGGAAMDQRVLRLEFISRVLGHFGFSICAKGDLLDARFSRNEEEKTLKCLAKIGTIMGITKLMDMGLTDLSQVDVLVEEFLQHNRPE